MGRLTTHVLDTSKGMPAAGIPIELHALRDTQQVKIADAVTNADGRTDVPLLVGPQLVPGVYELTFHMADYFARSGAPVTSPPFLGDVVIRVGLADPQAHYHVPLLIAPHGYSTYRGS